jgi:hypothetical protein
VEGTIPDGHIVEMDSSGRRVIDKVDLDGVVVVAKPSYKPSVLSSVYKALNELPPKVQDSLRNRLKKRERQKDFFEEKYSLMDILWEMVEEIMADFHADKDKTLEIVFDQFRDEMIRLLLDNQDQFEQKVQKAEIDPTAQARAKVFKDMAVAVNRLTRFYGGKRNARTAGKTVASDHC